MEEGEVLEPQAALLGWYEKVHGRNVDLVGDYAGNELFLVEGDSLLLHCLDNLDVDFDRGFQLLHAVHSVEAFLAALLQRKANFHIAFFDRHAPFCVPTHVADHNIFKYNLCRAVVIRHLSVNLPKVHPSVEVMRFRSYQDPAFVEYVDKSGLYFVMCHDGASATMRLPDLPDDAPGKKASGDVAKMPQTVTKSEKQRRQVFRKMIFWFISRGINVALTNSVEWHDTKIMAMVQERSRRINRELRRAEEVLQEPLNGPEDDDTVQSANTGDLKSAFIGIQGALPDMKSESHCLVVAALQSLLATRPEWKADAAAFVVQSVLLRHVPLASRRLPPAAGLEDLTFLATISAKMQSLLNHPQWQNTLIETSSICDVADLVDGRLLSWVMAHPEADVSSYGSEATSEIELLMKAISVGSDPTDRSTKTSRSQHEQKPTIDTSPAHRLLPFSHPVFDKHLQSIHVEVEKSSKTAGPAGDTAKTFRELTHWHNTKPLQRGPKPVLTEWQKKKAMRSNAIFQRELHQYAVSLTSSVGKALNPERIHTGEVSAAVAPKSASADAMKADNVARIAERNEKKFVAAWQTQIKDFAAIKDPRARFVRASNYLTTLPSERRDIIGSEVELYMLSTLLTIWSGMRRDDQSDQDDAIRFAGLIFEALNRMQKVDGSSTTKAVQRSLQMTNDSLGLAFKFPITSKVDRALSFQYALQAVDPSMKLESSMEFELNHCGPYLDRSIDSAPDSRVKFEPDAWQRRVLDLIDEKKSVLVVAPTSAGKTFISFYAMKQVLQESDDGILVYVAPTKALVNQIAAELQAQFSKNYKYPGKSVWAIHTRDYRVNDPQGCQVLVTVPHILQIMLLAPSNAKSTGWSQRVRRIIFDEIHCIGQAEDGVVWEQLLLLSPCPIIALSATVGNPQEFTSWLQDTQSSMGYELNKVEHPYRYSDLRKFVYQPPSSFKFQPLEVADTLGLPSLDGASGLMYMHPVAALVNENRGMPHDLHLEPRDCLSLWTSMKKHSNERYAVDDSLDPTKNMPAIIKKVDVLRWESELKSLLTKWMNDSQSPFRLVREELSRPLHPEEHSNGTSSKDDERVSPDDLMSTTLPLLHTLNERNALPAILFNYDRTACEKIGQDLLAKLAKAEEEYKLTSPVWKKKLTSFENWKKVEAKKSKRAPAKKSKSKGEDGEDDEGSKADREKEAAELESNPFASFNPDAPISGFVFADEKALLPSEFAGIKKRLEYRHIKPWLIDALERGIGVHHAGMNRAYRQAVETLFRKRFLRVVVATGTLALGINMPCKTVVFSGDSVFLTALNYRQGAGRAGRRGFDLLGNVIFQNIQLDKICRLVSSRLPDLNGHFPITTTLVLRLFSLLHESKESAFAKKSIDSLLSQPRLFLGGEAFKDQVLHHLRYSIEYLRRQHLISDEGRPINFAGTVSHLYFTENSSFAFHTLLKDGYFNKLCAGFKAEGPSEPRILDTLMLTLSHLFGRRHCRRADQEFVDEVVKRYSSHVFLPKMPKDAEKILMAHNSETLDVFSTYVRTFVEQHTERMGTDRKLPLTEMLVGGADAQVSGIDSLPATVVRSAFVALSGHDDEFKSIAELCRTVRDGVFLESSAIPHVALYPQEAEMPLNAYLYDFYRHGDVSTIEKANGVRRGDIWFLLNDFSMVLATIVTSFKNFMNMDEDADLEFIEVAGSGDLHEIDEDDRIARQEECSQGGARTTLPVGRSAVQQSQTVAAPSNTQSKKKKKVADSWDEDDDAASSSSAESEWDAGGSDDDAASTSTRPTTVSSSTPAWEEESGEGLKNVAIAFQRLKLTFDQKFFKMWA